MYTGGMAVGRIFFLRWANSLRREGRRSRGRGKYTGMAWGGLDDGTNSPIGRGLRNALIYAPHPIALVYRKGIGAGQDARRQPLSFGSLSCAITNLAFTTASEGPQWRI